MHIHEFLEQNGGKEKFTGHLKKGADYRTPQGGKIFGIKDQNITDISGFDCEDYVGIILSGNQISSLEGFDPKNLDTLFLNDNQISSLEGFDPKNLRRLELRSNQISSLEGFDPKNLEDLHLRGNQITSIDNFDCKNLKFLSLSHNQIVSIKHFKIPNPTPHSISIYIGSNPLEYVDKASERGIYNNIEDIGEMHLCPWYVREGARIEQEIKQQQK